MSDHHINRAMSRMSASDASASQDAGGTPAVVLDRRRTTRGPIERRRIHRRLENHPTTPPSPSAEDLVVTFTNPETGKSLTRDFATLGLPADIAVLLSGVFRHHLAPSRPATQKLYWSSVAVLARFIRQDPDVNAVTDLTTPVVGRYKAWLDRQTHVHKGTPWSEKHRAIQLNCFRILMVAAKRLPLGERLPRMDFPSALYPDREPPADQPHLSDTELKAVIEACESAIDEVMRRFEAGRAVLLKDAHNDEPERDRLIRLVAHLTATGNPTYAAMLARGATKEAIARHGGLHYLRSCVGLTPDTLAPYFVLLLIRLAGNVEAILALSRDCQHEDPADEHRAVIQWEKPRAGRRPAQSMSPSSDRRRAYSATNLVDQILVLTGPLLSRARPRDRNRLFLVIHRSGGSIGPINLQSINTAARRFRARANAAIDRWNRDHPKSRKVALPEFALRDLRGSVVEQVYRGSGGDIRRAQRAAGHRFLDTTERYVQSPATRAMRTRIIAQLQRQLVDQVTGCRPEDDASGPRNDAPASASFGHLCLDPFAGPSPKLTKTRLCSQFHKCLKCPGLVIPVDSQHLARLLRARDAFESARRNLEPERWNILFADLYCTLVEGILPRFPDGLHAEARALADKLPALPELE